MRLGWAKYIGTYILKDVDLGYNTPFEDGYEVKKILPRDFQPDDVGRPAMTEDDTTDERFLFSHGTGKLYASVDIPGGFTVESVMIHGSNTGAAVTVYEASIENKDVTSKGTGNPETAINITSVTSTSSNYLLIEISSGGATDEIHGGYIKMRRYG